MTDDLRLVLGFTCRDADAKGTSVELTELEGALRLTICGDAIVVLTPTQAAHLQGQLDMIRLRIVGRQGDQP